MNHLDQWLRLLAPLNPRQVQPHFSESAAAASPDEIIESAILRAGIVTFNPLKSFAAPPSRYIKISKRTQFFQAQPLHFQRYTSSAPNKTNPIHQDRLPPTQTGITARTSVP